MDTVVKPFLQYASDVRVVVEQRLNDYCHFGEDCPTRLSDAISHSLFAGGKRLRPLLVLSAATACGSTFDAAMPAACAVEMIHTYSLIHDDLPAMDDDELRRGKPTCHIAFDEATAILAGDGLLTFAFQLLAEEVKPAACAARCCAELARAAGVAGMVGGQVDDLSAEHQAGNLEQLKHIHRRKTGALIRASLRLGGLVADAAADQMGNLDRYGAKLGLAFQIVDDLLDRRGETDKLGKNSGQDSCLGKLTFPSLLGEEESFRQAQELIDEAIAALQPFGEKAEQLVSLARYVLDRDH